MPLINSKNCPPEQATSLALPVSRSAAREVWRCRDIRRELLQLLDQADLARCMRVEHEGLQDVASVLYRVMDDKQTSVLQTGSGPRNALYCSAVHEITIVSWTLVSELEQALGLLPSRDRSGSTPPASNSPADEAEFNKLTLPYRQEFPALRRLRVEEFDGRTWVVHFDPRRVPSDVDDQSMRPTPSHPLPIDIFRTPRFTLRSKPPTSFTHGLIPLPSVALSYRFALVLTQDEYDFGGCEARDRWVAAIRTNPCFGNLSRSVSLDDLPIKLEDIVLLYQRQDTTGNPDRLQYIVVPAILPFDINQFRSFAAVASSSLRKLTLSHDRKYAKQNISVQDLPAVHSVIRDTLPALKELTLAIDGEDTIEEVSREWLREDGLDTEGQLSVLQITTHPHPRSLFNIIRYLIPWTKKTALLSVNLSEWGVWGLDIQAAYIKHLRSRSAAKRKILSVIDFATLDVGYPGQIPRLHYDADGQPIRRLLAKTPKWSSVTRELEDLANDDIIPDIQAKLAELAGVAGRFKEISKSATGDELKREMTALRKAVVGAADAANRMGIVTTNLGLVNEEMKDFPALLLKDSGGGEGSETEEYADNYIEEDGEEYEAESGLGTGEEDIEGVGEEGSEEGSEESNEEESEDGEVDGEEDDEED